MRKKRALLFTLVLFITGIFAFTLTGCNLFLRTQDPDYPYDVAVKNGYTGSEASWVASQYSAGSRERKLYEEAKADGYKGTFVDFLKEIGGAQDNTAAVNEALTSVVSIKTDTAWGAGVIYSLDKTAGDALIITNYHVVYGKNGISTKIGVSLYGENHNNPVMSATFYGGAAQYDLALIRIKGSEHLKESEDNVVYAKEASFGDSDSITVGEQVYAVGNPDGQGISATGGIVSVDAEKIQVERADAGGRYTYGATVDLWEIRMDASVNHGNSGGGLFNADGDLVGIVNARSEESGIVGFGYAIPANFAKAVVDNIIDNYADADGKVKLASLGFEYTVRESKGVYHEELSKYFKEEKIVVDKVSPSSGFKYNDILIKAVRVSATGEREELDIIREHMLDTFVLGIRQGDTVVITVSREGELLEKEIVFTNATSQFSAVS